MDFLQNLNASNDSFVALCRAVWPLVESGRMSKEEFVAVVSTHPDWPSRKKQELQSSLRAKRVPRYELMLEWLFSPVQTTFVKPGQPQTPQPPQLQQAPRNDTPFDVYSNPARDYDCCGDCYQKRLSHPGRPFLERIDNPGQRWPNLNAVKWSELRLKLRCNECKRPFKEAPAPSPDVETKPYLLSSFTPFIR